MDKALCRHMLLVKRDYYEDLKAILLPSSLSAAFGLSFTIIFLPEQHIPIATRVLKEDKTIVVRMENLIQGTQKISLQNLYSSKTSIVLLVSFQVLNTEEGLNTAERLVMDPLLVQQDGITLKSVLVWSSSAHSPTPYIEASRGWRSYITLMSDSAPGSFQRFIVCESFESLFARSVRYDLLNIFDILGMRKACDLEYQDGVYWFSTEKQLDNKDGTEKWLDEMSRLLSCSRIDKSLLAHATQHEKASLITAPIDFVPSDSFPEYHYLVGGMIDIVAQSIVQPITEHGRLYTNETDTTSTPLYLNREEALLFVKDFPLSRPERHSQETQLGAKYERTMRLFKEMLDAMEMVTFDVHRGVELLLDVLKRHNHKQAIEQINQLVSAYKNKKEEHKTIKHLQTPKMARLASVIEQASVPGKRILVLVPCNVYDVWFKSEDGLAELALAWSMSNLPEKNIVTIAQDAEESELLSRASTDSVLFVASVETYRNSYYLRRIKFDQVRTCAFEAIVDPVLIRDANMVVEAFHDRLYDALLISTSSVFATNESKIKHLHGIIRYALESSAPFSSQKRFEFAKQVLISKSQKDDMYNTKMMEYEDYIKVFCDPLDSPSKHDTSKTSNASIIVQEEKEQQQQYPASLAFIQSRPVTLESLRVGSFFGTAAEFAKLTASSFIAAAEVGSEVAPFIKDMINQYIEVKSGKKDLAGALNDTIALVEKNEPLISKCSELSKNFKKLSKYVFGNLSDYLESEQFSKKVNSTNNAQVSSALDTVKALVRRVVKKLSGSVQVPESEKQGDALPSQNTLQEQQSPSPNSNPQPESIKQEQVSRIGVMPKAQSNTHDQVSYNGLRVTGTFLKELVSKNGTSIDSSQDMLALTCIKEGCFWLNPMSLRFFLSLDEDDSNQAISVYDSRMCLECYLLGDKLVVNKVHNTQDKPSRLSHSFKCVSLFKEMLSQMCSLLLVLHGSDSKTKTLESEQDLLFVYAHTKQEKANLSIANSKTHELGLFTDTVKYGDILSQDFVYLRYENRYMASLFRLPPLKNLSFNPEKSYPVCKNVRHGESLLLMGREFLHFWENPEWFLGGDSQFHANPHSVHTSQDSNSTLLFVSGSFWMMDRSFRIIVHDRALDAQAVFLCIYMNKTVYACSVCTTTMTVDQIANIVRDINTYFKFWGTTKSTAPSMFKLCKYKD